MEACLHHSLSSVSRAFLVCNPALGVLMDYCAPQCRWTPDVLTTAPYLFPPVVLWHHRRRGVTWRRCQSFMHRATSMPTAQSYDTRHVTFVVCATARLSPYIAWRFAPCTHPPFCFLDRFYSSPVDVEIRERSISGGASHRGGAG